MTKDDQFKTLQMAMEKIEAELTLTYGADTVSLAKAGIGALIETIAVNTVIHSDMNLGNTMCAAFKLLKAVDMISDHLTDNVHSKS